MATFNVFGSPATENSETAFPESSKQNRLLSLPRHALQQVVLRSGMGSTYCCSCTCSFQRDLLGGPSQILQLWLGEFKQRLRAEMGDKALLGIPFHNMYSFNSSGVLRPHHLRGRDWLLYKALVALGWHCRLVECAVSCETGGECKGLSRARIGQDMTEGFLPGSGPGAIKVPEEFQALAGRNSLSQDEYFFLRETNGELDWEVPPHIVWPFRGVKWAVSRAYFTKRLLGESKSCSRSATLWGNAGQFRVFYYRRAALLCEMEPCDSTHVKVVETEKVLKTLIKQLNSSYTPALNEAEGNGSGKAQGPGPDALKGAMQRLLEEHDQLIQQQNDLLNRRQPLSQSVRAPPVPWPSSVATTTAGAPIRWTAPANTSSVQGGQPARVPGAASPPSPRLAATPPLGEASPGVPFLCASPKHAGRAIQVAASPRAAAISPQSSPARSPTRGGSLTNLAMAFGAPGGATSPMRPAGSGVSPTRPAQAPSFQVPEPARTSAARAMSPSLVREMGSPKDSPKATPKSTPKSSASRSPKGSPTAKGMEASPSPLQGLQSSASGKSLMAVFVDMQTGEEQQLTQKRSLYSI
ncbi:unnamed protein product [Symbiodinium sp. CCMP2456]|nr:unnamed protein product [Symbiodinium sp. CCMP2456]